MIKKGNNSPNFVDRVGEIRYNNQGCKMTIIEYYNAFNISVIFEDGWISKNKTYNSFKKGSIKNLYYPEVYNIGFIGDGDFKSSINKSLTKESLAWWSILKRCYDKRELLKCPTYKDKEVCEEWKCFQNFAQWFKENYNPSYMEKWEIDKDILVKDNKIYSPETCCFVPQEINKLFTKRQNYRGNCPIGVSFHKDYKKYSASISKYGVSIDLGFFNTAEEAFLSYKVEKENYIKEVANKWEGLIEERVYLAMINYKVEIND